MRCAAALQLVPVLVIESSFCLWSHGFLCAAEHDVVLAESIMVANAAVRLLLLAAALDACAAGSTRTRGTTECVVFQTRKLVYFHAMKCGGLSVDAMMRCRCASASTPCALLREDGSAKHASNVSGDLVTRFRDSMLYGSVRCGGGPACSAAGVGHVPHSSEGDAPAPALRVSRRNVGRSVSHETLVEGAQAPCAAQLLATHQSVAVIRARPYWAGAHFVTVLREPVARVWSFYQYVRRKSSEFQTRPLLHFLLRWRTFLPNTTAGAGGSPHWHWRACAGRSQGL